MPKLCWRLVTISIPTVTLQINIVCHTAAKGLKSFHSSVILGIQGNDNSHRFADTWDSVYTADSLTSVPWYVIAGNHDYKGNVSAQIAYSQDNARWKFPSIYHKQSFTSADGVTVDVLLIDTVDLAGNYLQMVLA